MNLAILAFLVIVSFTQAKFSAYKEIVNRGKVGELYRNFKREANLNFEGAEDSERFLVFKRNVELVGELNAADHEKAEFDLNKFSVWTEVEKRRLTSGLNNTLALKQPQLLYIAKRSESVKEKHFWTDEGAVTPPVDQGWCGSCWAFSTVATIETNYKIKTNALQKFSEQEIIDCTYDLLGGFGDPWKDGCDGGWMWQGMEYLIEKNRLASADEYPLFTKNGKEVANTDCLAKEGKKKNSLLEAKVTGYSKLDETEEAHIQALQTDSIAVAFMVTDRFYTYRRGIYKDGTQECAKQWANHAVHMIGYNADYILVKNSWGTDWGDDGFVKFTRGFHNCGLYRYSYVPVMERDKGNSGSALTASVKPTDYNPKDSDPSDDCQDERDDCQLELCFDKTVNYRDCRRTCQTCGVDLDAEDNATECGNNLMRCPADGVCRHRHICRFITVAANATPWQTTTESPGENRQD